MNTWKNTNILREMTIELTNQCPQACVFCSSLAGKDTTELPLSMVEGILREAKDLGVVNVAFSGGEPLLYEDIFNCIDLTSRLGMIPYLYSGGIVHGLDHQRIPIPFDAIDKMKKAGIYKIYLSIHAYSKRIHDALSGKDGNYDLTVESFKRTVGAGIQLGLHVLVTRNNYMELYTLAENFLAMGASDIKPLILMFQGRAKNKKDTLGLTKEAQPILLDQINKLISKYGAKIPVGCVWKGILHDNANSDAIIPECKVGKSVLSIKANGDVVPCAARKFQPVGNIYNTSLSNVWHSLSQFSEPKSADDMCSSNTSISLVSNKS